MTLSIGSLFSGIGGLELGLERAGLGSVVWQVERSAFCRHVLARHWPDAERFDDVRTVGAHNLAPVDVLCGGFPCQDLSPAGKRAGLAGDRSGLVFEYLRIIEEIAPRWVVVENVAHTWRRWVPVVRRELWTRGYASVPLRIRACDVGARHERARIFLVAAADPDRLWQLQPGRRLAELGRRSDHSAAADPDRPGLQDGQRKRGDLGEAAGEAAERDFGAVVPWEGLPARPWMVRGVHGLPGGMDGPWRAAGWTPARLREARIRSLGNSVVPACAEVVGRWIVSCMNTARSAA